MFNDGFLQLLPDNDQRCAQLWSLAAALAGRLAPWTRELDLEASPLRNRPVRVTVLHPGGGVGRFVDRSVCVGGGGAMVLHHGYLHPTTECQLALTTVWGASEEISGRVRECVHLAGTVHLVEMGFDRPVDLARYIEGFVPAGDPDGARTDPNELSGHVLVIDDLAINLQLVECVLKSTRLQCECFEALPAALERIRHSHFNLVICDAHLEPGREEGVVQLLRAASHRGPLVLLVGDPRAVRKADQELTTREVALRMPVTPDALLEQASMLLRTDPSRQLPEQIESTLSSDARLQGVLHEYLAFSRQQVEAMRRGIESGDVPAVRQLCQALKESGGSFGFETLTKVAGAAVTALDSTASIQESLGELDHVIEAVMRLKAPGVD